KVAGVTFSNDDGSERQEIIQRCSVGEQLTLRHDAYNAYSMFATQVLRSNGEQLGHAPEYLAERICIELEEGYNPTGILKNITGGTWDKPIRGVNFAVFFFAKDVTDSELRQYVATVLANEA
ncbi:MAG TPA: HIRAN domain-containing protein, partial [Fimbriiglobus sp.]